MQNIVRLGLILAVCCVAWTTSLESVFRKKRSSLELYTVTKHVTGKKFMEVAKLNFYGCWCGVGGGGTPKDPIDQCCKDHDKCYDAGTAGNWWKRQCKINFKLVPYSYKCSGGTCTCKNSSGSCAGKACRCDVTFAKCIKKNWGLWNNKYVGSC